MAHAPSLFIYSNNALPFASLVQRPKIQMQAFNLFKTHQAHLAGRAHVCIPISNSPLSDPLRSSPHHQWSVSHARDHKEGSTFSVPPSTGTACTINNYYKTNAHKSQKQAITHSHCASLSKCVIFTHHHGRAMLLATCLCSFFLAEKGSPSFKKKERKTTLPGWSTKGLQNPFWIYFRK